MDGNQQGVQLIESEEDKKKKGQAAQPGSAFAPTGPSAPSAPSGTQQARAAQAAGPTRGTGFTGVGRFLQANVGSRLGQEVAGRVSQAGQQAASRLGQAAGQFQQQLGQKQQELSAQQQAAQAALQRIAGGGAQQIQPEPIKEPQQVQQKTTQSISLTPSEQDIAAYQAVAGGQIQAPTGLQDVEDVRAQAVLAGKLAKGTQTAAGRTGLLQQVVGRGPRQYTAGQSALDALILGQAGGQLAAARRASAGLGRQVETQSRLAEEQARQFGSEARSAKEALTGERGSFISDILAKGEAKRSAYEKQQADFIKRAKDEIASGEPISREVAEAIFGPDVDRISTMGLSKQEIANLLESGELATLQTSLTPQQAAQIEALKKLGSEAGIYRSPEEVQQLAGRTIDGAATLGSGFKFDTSGKYTEKQKEFEKQKKIIDQMIQEFKTTGKTSLRPAGRMAPISYESFAQKLEDYLYGKETSPQGVIKRIEGPRQQTADLDALSMLETARGGPFALEENPTWVGEEMRSSYDALRDAILKMQKLGLTGEQIKIKPKSGE